MKTRSLRCKLPVWHWVRTHVGLRLSDSASGASNVVTEAVLCAAPPTLCLLS
jgi:hypothetical protein